MRDEDYFREAISFLKEYESLFNFKWTDFFAYKPWTRIPDEWLEALVSLPATELNQLPFSCEQDRRLPASFTQFAQRARSLCLQSDDGQQTSPCFTSQVAQACTKGATYSASGNVSVEPSAAVGDSCAKQDTSGAPPVVEGALDRHYTHKQSAPGAPPVVEGALDRHCTHKQSAPGTPVVEGALDRGCTLQQGALGAPVVEGAIDRRGTQQQGALGAPVELGGALDRRCTQQQGALGAPVELGGAFDRRGMSDKKVHEVERLSAFVHQQCAHHQCQTIVDVGSGLGYVSQVLSSCYGRDVIGLERQQHMARSAAESRQHSSMATTRTDRGEELRPTQGSSRSVQFTIENTQQCYMQFDQLLHKILNPNSISVGIYDENSGSCHTELIKSDSLPEEQVDSCLSCDYVDDSTFSKSNQDCVQFQRDKCTDSHETQNVANSKCMCKPRSVISPQSVGNCGDTERRDGEQSACSTCASVREERGVCLMGLHCCADLTPTMLRFFLRSERLRCLVCLGCCYHKMARRDGAWEQFPMSSALQTTLDSLSAHALFTQYAMRLAAQQSGESWRGQSREDHEFHTKNVAYRGILQLFNKQEQITPRKLRRKVAGRSDFNHFSTYTDAVMKSFRYEGLEDSYIKKKLHDLYVQNEQYFAYIELVKLLQVILQPVLECLLQRDRLAFLRQHGLHACALPLFSPEISPRNVAIVASKS